MPPFPKGSQEMKDYMAKIRMKKGDPRLKNIGGKKTKPTLNQYMRDTKVEVPILGQQSIAIPEFFATTTKTGFKLVNPLTKSRNLASRKGRPSIQLIRKPVNHMILMSHSTQPIPLMMFNKKDRETINTHFKVVKENKDKDPVDVPNSEPFKNKERGRPEKMAENIRINKERVQAKKEANKLKKGRPVKFETEEARAEAIRKTKRESAKRARAKLKGGSISAKDLKALHQSAYKKDKDKQVGDWVLDESISKPTASVYVSQKTKQPIVIHRGTEGTLKDWSNNLAYVSGLSKKTQRYKDSEEVQKQAEEKYGDTLTSGHSQGGIYSKMARNKKGIIDINPASMGEVATEGTTIRAKNDPVSLLAGLTNMFRKSDKNITTSAKSNPLEAHSLDILDELGDKQLGEGLVKKFTAKQLMQLIKDKNAVIADLEENAYEKNILGNGTMKSKMEHLSEKMTGGGIHHHHHYHMNGSGMSGMGIEDMMRDAGKYIQPLADAGMDRAMKEIRGSGKKCHTMPDGSLMYDSEMKGVGMCGGMTKGSQEAKDIMARVRAGRKAKKEESDEEAPKMRRGRFVKGSQEAKDYMASIRRRK